MIAVGAGRTRKDSTMLLARTFAVGLCCLAFTAAPAAALGPEAAGVLASLQYFDQEVQQGLRAFAAAAETPGLEVPAELATEAAALLDGVRDLEVEAQALPEVDRDVVLAKVRSVRWQAEELVRLASRPTATPREADGSEPVGPRWPYPNQVQLPADHCEDAPVIGLGSVTGTTEGADGGGAEASCGASYDAPDVWYQFVAPADERRAYFISTIGSGFDTVLSAYRGCPGLLINQIGCNDDRYGLQSGLTVWADPGEAVLLRVSGAVAASGPLQLNVSTGGTLSGTLRDAETGLAPIDAVSVRLYTSPGYPGLSTHTDAEGTFTIAGIPPATFFLRVGDETDRYVDELYSNTPCYGTFGSSGCSPQDATPLSILPHDNPPLTVYIERGGTLSGRVYDVSTGEDLAGWITVYDADGSELVSFSVSGSWTWTEAPSGQLYVAAGADDRRKMLFGGGSCNPQCDFSTATPVHVEAGTSVDGVDIGLPMLRGVAGRVVAEPDGQPIYNALVRLLRSDGTLTDHSDRTGSDGAYAIDGIEDGDYLVLVSSQCHQGELYHEIPCSLPFQGELSCSAAEGRMVRVALDHVEPPVEFSLRPIGGVSGAVREEGTGSPIPGATVRVLRSSGWPMTTTTNADGSWAVACVTAESVYVLVPFAPGHVGEVYPDVICPGGDCDISRGTRIPVAQDTPASGILFELGPGGAIEGTVRDEATLLPVEGQAVRLSGPTGGTRATVNTDAEGRYRADSLAPEPHFASTDHFRGFLREIYPDIVCPASWCSPSIGEPITVVEGGTTGGIDFDLRLGARVSGLLETVTGAPANARVSVFNDLGHEIGWSFADGAWFVGGLPAGTYYAAATPGTPLLPQVFSQHDCAPTFPLLCTPLEGTPIILGTSEHRSDVDFSLQQMGKLEGTIHTSLRSSSTGDVLVLASDGTFRRVEDHLQDGQLAWTANVPAGEYVLWLEPTVSHLGQVYPGIPCDDVGCALVNGTPVAVDLNSTVTGLDFSPELLEPATFSGAVTDAESGLLMPGVRIDLYSPDGSYRGMATTRSDGMFFIPKLHAGPYLLRAIHGGYVTQLLGGFDCWPTDCPTTAGTAVEAVPGEPVRHLDFRLRRKPNLTISGHIESSLYPHATATARLYDKSGAAVTSLNARSYTFSELKPGTYYVTAEVPYSSVRREVYQGTPCAEGACTGVATPIVLTESNGSISGIDFQLEAPPSVAGTVLAPDGSPLSASLRFFDQDGRLSLTTTANWTGGFFTFLTADQTYFVEVSEPGFATEIYQGFAGTVPPTQGTPLVLTWGEHLTDLDFTLDALPRISGTVRTDEGEPPPSGVRLRFLDVWGREVSSEPVGGTFDVAVEPGTYYIVADGGTYLGTVLYPDVPCLDEDCDLSRGQTVTVGVNQSIGGFAFVLPERRGDLRFNVVDSVTRTPLWASVTLYPEGGGAIYTGTDPSGTFQHRLLQGTYFLTFGESDHIHELHQDIVCEWSCNPLLGTPIVIRAGEVLDLGSLDLEPGYVGFLGRITARDGSPVPFVVVDAWRAHDLSHADTAVTDARGVFRLPMWAGSFYLSTDAGGDWIDQVHPGVSCPDGPAWTGDCDVTRGTPLEAAAIFPTHADFVLTSRFAIFADGFDDGTFAAWTVTP